MSDHIFEDAIQCAVTRAEKTVRNLRWFKTIETRGAIENGRVQSDRDTLKVSFTMDAERCRRVRRRQNERKRLAPAHGRSMMAVVAVSEPIARTAPA